MDRTFYEKCAEGFIGEFAKLWRARSHSGPLVSGIQNVSFRHGTKTVLNDLEGTERTSEFEKLECAFELSNSAIESGDAEAFSAAVARGIEQMRTAILGQLFRCVENAAVSAGNAINVGGRSLTGNDLCELIERVDVQFDSHAQMRMPTMVFSPELEEQVYELLDQPDVRLRIDSILLRKFLDRYTLKLE